MNDEVIYSQFFQFCSFFLPIVQQFQLVVIGENNMSWMWIKSEDNGFTLFLFSKTNELLNYFLVAQMHPIECTSGDYSIGGSFKFRKVFVRLQVLYLVFVSAWDKMGSVSDF